MKTMNYGSVACEIAVIVNYTFISQVPCQYDRDTVIYAVERFFTQCTRFRRECTKESFELRVAKGRARRKYDFVYLIPAVLMELPGNWVRLKGNIDSVGVKVKKVEILKEHPCFTEKRADKLQSI